MGPGGKCGNTITSLADKDFCGKKVHQTIHVWEYKFRSPHFFDNSDNYLKLFDVMYFVGFVKPAISFTVLHILIYLPYIFNHESHSYLHHLNISLYVAHNLRWLCPFPTGNHGYKYSELIRCKYVHLLQTEGDTR